MMRGPSARAPSSTSSNGTPCSSEVLGLKRGPWTPEEDKLLANYIRREGEGRWRTLPKRAGLLRCGKSCRLRWLNYLRPCLKRGQITPDEEDLILRLHRLLGNRWCLIAGRIPGRTDNEIKNYWNTHMSKKLISQGLDPRTHKPLVSLSNSNRFNNNDHRFNATTTPTTSYTDPHDPGDFVKDAAAASSSSELIHHHEPHQTSAVCIITPSDDHNTWHIPVNKDQKGYLDEYENNEDGNLEVLFDGDESGALTTGNMSNDMDHLIGSDIGRILHVDEDRVSYNSCYDDVFSSFLDSLTEEDVFFNRDQQEDDLQQNQTAASSTKIA